ncbi:MAG: deoxyribodipyrimidine photolyase [Flavobacteriales bacterium]|nr:MAG: deoxyribodipyrimidine photolyase [Flavobacteriales bacterium]
MNKDKISIFWFRRDLRLQHNIGLKAALSGDFPVLSLFIFDDDILDELPEDDARVTFIYKKLSDLDRQLNKHHSGVLIKKGIVADVWESLIEDYNIQEVYFNHDYEPASIKRDQEIKKFLLSKNIKVDHFKDQVIFEKNEVLKNDDNPYTVYTPYKNKWLETFKKSELPDDTITDKLLSNVYAFDNKFPALKKLGFSKSSIAVKPINFYALHNYGKYRDYPAKDGISYLSPHLRFGTVSIREMVRKAEAENEVFLSELVWREFFMQILYHFPKVVTENFKSKYDGIKWRNNEKEFEKWCRGQTGYELVDAGMRQLNTTGYMHNRVRMITAGFLCKHLLIDWRWGEAYFAKKLLDYELSSNNGNWQWAAGTGCDAAPYFRIFNPHLQLKKYDEDLKYTQKYIQNYSANYLPRIVEHKFARARALESYKKGIDN